MGSFDVEPFLLSFRLAAVTTLLLFVVSVPLAWMLANWRSPLKPVIETFFSLPIVLPPTVLGFYLLFWEVGWCKFSGECKMWKGWS